MQISQLLAPLLGLCSLCHLLGIAAQTSCGVGGYDLSCLSGTDFTATSPLEHGYEYIFRPCGMEESFLPCGRNDSANVMLCQWWTSTAANNTFNYSIALYPNASALSWSTLTDSSGNYLGIGFTVSNGDGGGCEAGIPHRTAVVSFYCDPSDSQVFSINGDIEGSCSYYFSLNTSLVCPSMTRSCSAPPAPSSSSSSLSSGAVAAIVIVVLLLVAALTVGLLLWRRRRGRASSDGLQSADGQYDNTTARFRPLQ
jgi:hypothetical protein